MTALAPKLKIKQMFFDSPAVMRRVDKARRRVLTRQGALVRQVARRSMRRRKGPSPPGKPPHAHRGDLRRMMFFVYDSDTDTVVVGPMAYDSRAVPGILEHGGTVRLPGFTPGR